MCTTDVQISALHYVIVCLKGLLMHEYTNLLCVVLGEDSSVIFMDILLLPVLQIQRLSGFM